MAVKQYILIAAAGDGDLKKGNFQLKLQR